MPDSEPKLFTLSEANVLLPKIANWMATIFELRRRMMEVVSSKGGIAKGNGHAIESVEDLQRDMNVVANAANDIHGLIERIASTGAEIKDLDRGLVDFQHERDGRIVYLCWKLGEDKIQYWHELHTGYEGRMPL